MSDDKYSLTIRCTLSPLHEHRPSIIAVVHRTEGLGWRAYDIQEHDEHSRDPLFDSWNLQCPVCGFGRSVRGTHFSAACDRLEAAGVSSVELTHLAAILPSSKTES